MQAVLTDFGSASPLVTQVTSRSIALTVQENAAIFTTAPYRAPELFDTPSACTIDGKTDIWSMGCVIYSIFFSKTPFENAIEGGLSTLSVMNGHFSFPLGHPWPADYLNIIEQCLLVDPTLRASLDTLKLLLRRLGSPPLDLTHRSVIVTAAAAAAPSASVAGSFSSSSSSSSSSSFSIAATAKKSSMLPPAKKEVFFLESLEFDPDFADFDNDSETSDGERGEASFSSFTIDATPHAIVDDDEEFGEFTVAAAGSSNTPNALDLDVEFGEFESPPFAQVSVSSPPHAITPRAITLEELVFYNANEILFESPCVANKVKATSILNSMSNSKNVKKNVYCVVTRQAIIIRKSSSSNSKIYNVIGLSNSTNLIKSTHLSVGSFGVIVSGYCPRRVGVGTSGKESRLSSASNTALSEDEEGEAEKEGDNQGNASTDSGIFSNRFRTSSSSSTGFSTSFKQEASSATGRMVECKFEVSFASELIVTTFIESCYDQIERM